MAPYLGSTDSPADETTTPKLLQIHCSGTPYEVSRSSARYGICANEGKIGRKHGSEAKIRLSRTIDFYTGMFKETAKMDWDKVREIAMTYEPVMRRKWPHYLEEIQGRRCQFVTVYLG